MSSENLSSFITDMRKKLKDDKVLSGKVSQKRKELDDLVRQITDTAAELDRLKNEWETYRKKEEKELHDRRAEVNASIDRHYAALGQRQDRAARVEEDQRIRETRLNRLERELSNREVEAARREEETAQRDKELSALSAAVKQEREEVDSLLIQARNVEGRNKDVKASLTAQTVELNELRNDTHAKIRSLALQRGEAEKELAAIQKLMSAVKGKEAKIAQDFDDLVRKQSELAAEVKHLKALKKDVDDKEAVLKSMRADVDFKLARLEETQMKSKER